MDTENGTWKKIRVPFDENVSEAVQQQHHAAQFIAMIGKQLIPNESDDSNTNMEYLINKSSLIGNTFGNGMQLGLQLSELVLFIQGEKLSHPMEFSLSGMTKEEVFLQLKNVLAELKVDVKDFTDKLHYEMPDHALDHGVPFGNENRKFLQEATNYRHNAEIILEKLVREFKDAAPLKIWPHHFDTGTFIPLAYNNKGDVSKSIGLGWAIPDTMIDEPYYYLSLWSEDESIDFNKLPALESGNWILTSWQGGVLKHSDILKFNSAEEQLEEVRTFFKSGINILSG